MTMRSEQINELAAALAKAQGAMQNATMNRTNPHFKSKYADLSSVLDAARGPLSAAGIAVVQTMHYNEHGVMVLLTTLIHSSGQFITTEYPLPNTTKPHEMGSALTYARRYSLSALICNASDEDDDGNAAMNNNGPRPINGGDKIDPKQLEQLTKLCDEIGEGTVDALCKYKGIASLADLPRNDFIPTVGALNRKKAQLAPREAAE